MSFMKYFLMLTLLSVTFVEKSWADRDVGIGVPRVCVQMVKFLALDSSRDAKPFSEFLLMNHSAIKDKVLYDPADEKRIIDAYEYLAPTYSNIAATNPLEAQEACLKKLNSKDKFGSFLFSRDFSNDASSSSAGGAFAATEAETAKVQHKKTAATPGTCIGNLKADCADDYTGTSSLNRDFTAWLDFGKIKLGPVSGQAYDSADCACHISNLEILGKSTKDMGPAIDQEIEKIKDIVVQESSKNFMIEYTSLNEDLRYYQAAAAEMLDYKGGEGLTEPQQTCSEAGEFQKAVDELCKKNGTTAGSAQRMSGILSVFDPNLKNLSFNDAFQALNNDIGVLELPKQLQKPGFGSKLKRDDFDRTRKVIGEDSKDPEILFANRMISSVLLNDNMRESFKENLKTTKEPVYALIEMMSDPANDKYVEHMLVRMKEKFAVYKNPLFESLLSLKNEKKKVGADNHEEDHKNPFRIALAGMFFKGMKLDPSFKNLMLDPELFADISNKFRPKMDAQKGLLGVMKDDKAILMKKYAKRCETMKQEFAQNVCAKPSDVLNNASTSEIVDLVKNSSFKKSPDSDVVNMAICHFSKNSPDPKSVFSKVSSNRGQASDYSKRKQDPEQVDSSFAKVAVMLQDKAMADKLERMVSYGVNESNTSSKYKAAASHDSDQLMSYKPNKNESVAASSVMNSQMASAEVQSTNNREIASTKEYEVQKNISAPATISSTQPFVPAVSSAPTAQEEAKIAENFERVSRERLAKELSDSDNKHRVKEHISSLDEKDAEEIFRLRDQAIKDRQTISELRLQQERDKTDALRSEYEQLKTRFDNLEKTNAPAASAKAPSVSSGSTGSSDSSLPRFETATLSAPVAAASTGGRASGAGASVSSSAGGSATLGDSNSGSSNAAGSGSSVSSTVSTTSGSGASEGRGLALTVTQSVGSDGKIQASEDPNKALISYLNKNEPTVSQLQELKTSGLVLTEEDVSVDGQKVQKKKMIKFNELSPEAKSLVEQKLASIKLQEVKRNYSRQALILELFTASKKKSNLNVKKSGSLNF